MLFNLIILVEYIPQQFRKSIIVPIFKGGKKDRLERSNYRGITLQSVLCKVYETVLMNRISCLIKAKCNISCLQGACSKGLSSLNCAFLLHETIVHNVEKESPVYVTYFDTKTAFDTVWIKGLFYKLYNKGIRGKLWRILKMAYENGSCAVNINGLTDWFDVSVGVKQGGVLSMLMYICFINDLLLNIADTGLGCRIGDYDCGCIAYADDIAVCSLYPNCMQYIIDVALKYSQQWRFEFNPTKCAVLLFGEPANENFHINLC